MSSSRELAQWCNRLIAIMNTLVSLTHTRSDHLTNWTWIVVGILQANLIALSQIAIHLPGEIKTESRVTTIRRWLKTLKVDVVAASISSSRIRHIVIWSCAIFFNLVCVAIEGYFFAPDLIGDSLMGLIFQQIFAALATGWIITALFTSKESAGPIQPFSRSFFSWSWRLVISALSFVVFYFIFGGINYALVTKPYYETHAIGCADS